MIYFNIVPPCAINVDIEVYEGYSKSSVMH